MVMVGCWAMVVMVITVVMVGRPVGSVMVVMVVPGWRGLLAGRVVAVVLVGCSWVMAVMVVLAVRRPILWVTVAREVLAGIPVCWGGALAG